jgi:hypothetical protein
LLEVAERQPGAQKSEVDDGGQCTGHGLLRSVGGSGEPVR